MVAFLGAVVLAFGAIFIAEFGDKSQLLVLAFATRHAALPVAVGIIVAAAVIQGISVAVGAVLGAALPETLIAVIAGLAFLAVAAWTLREGRQLGARLSPRVIRIGSTVLFALAGLVVLVGALMSS